VEPTHRAKYKNRGNEAKKSLKTKEVTFCNVQKRTQNEPEFEGQMQKLNSSSEVARLGGKKPLTRLATLATLSPRERAEINVDGPLPWGEGPQPALSLAGAGRVRGCFRSIQTPVPFSRLSRQAIQIQRVGPGVPNSTSEFRFKIRYA
jgi:hypothetical protein